MVELERDPSVLWHSSQPLGKVKGGMRSREGEAARLPPSRGNYIGSDKLRGSIEQKIAEEVELRARRGRIGHNSEILLAISN